MLLIYLLPAICLVVIVGLGFLTFILYRGISTGGTLTPLFILVVGLVSACFVLPSPTHEERSFFFNQQDYIELVKLAEQGKLPKSEQCNTRVAFGVPEGFEKYIKDCILVYNDPNFTVEFWPRSYAAPILYVENVKDLKHHFTCSINGEIVKQLDSNWFLCRMEAD